MTTDELTVFGRDGVERWESADEGEGEGGYLSPSGILRLKAVGGGAARYVADAERELRLSFMLGPEHVDQCQPLPAFSNGGSVVGPTGPLGKEHVDSTDDEAHLSTGEYYKRCSSGSERSELSFPCDLMTDRLGAVALKEDFCASLPMLSPTAFDSLSEAHVQEKKKGAAGRPLLVRWYSEGLPCSSLRPQKHRAQGEAPPACAKSGWPCRAVSGGSRTFAQSARAFRTSRGRRRYCHLEDGCQAGRLSRASEESQLMKQDSLVVRLQKLTVEMDGFDWARGGSGKEASWNISENLEASSMALLERHLGLPMPVPASGSSLARNVGFRRVMSEGSREEADDMPHDMWRHSRGARVRGEGDDWPSDIWRKSRATWARGAPYGCAEDSEVGAVGDAGPLTIGGTEGPVSTSSEGGEGAETQSPESLAEPSWKDSSEGASEGEEGTASESEDEEEDAVAFLLSVVSRKEHPSCPSWLQLTPHEVELKKKGPQPNGNVHPMVPFLPLSEVPSRSTHFQKKVLSLSPGRGHADVQSSRKGAPAQAGAAAGTLKGAGASDLEHCSTVAPRGVGPSGAATVTGVGSEGGQLSSKGSKGAARGRRKLVPSSEIRKGAPPEGVGKQRLQSAAASPEHAQASTDTRKCPSAALSSPKKSHRLKPLVHHERSGGDLQSEPVAPLKSTGVKKSTGVNKSDQHLGEKGALRQGSAEVEEAALREGTAGEESVLVKQHTLRQRKEQAGGTTTHARAHSSLSFPHSSSCDQVLDRGPLPSPLGPLEYAGVGRNPLEEPDFSNSHVNLWWLREMAEDNPAFLRKYAITNSFMRHHSARL